MLQEITITNINCSGKWGWGWSCTPTGEDAYSIETPARPDYEGTLNQIRRAIDADRTYASLKSGGTFISTRWFWDGNPIHSTWGIGVVQNEENHIDDEGNLIVDREAEYGECWLGGLQIDPFETPTEIKIRVEIPE